MAVDATYGKRFVFNLESYCGRVFDIFIYQKGYVGAPDVRPLGASPVFRRRTNENVMGTSLELVAECQVDGEFSVLYTSDPTEFRVELFQDGYILFQGYVSPEMYSEPDVAPPYNVSITAVDGLGELKRADYVPCGGKMLDSLFKYILGNTGLDLPVYYINTIYSTEMFEWIGEKNGGYLFSDIYTSLDEYADKSYYDVLQLLLRSLNAKILQDADKWLVYRPNDLQHCSGGDRLIAYDAFGHRKYVGACWFGSSKVADMWPVGYLTKSVVQAKKQVTIKAEHEPKVNLLYDTLWNMSGTQYDPDRHRWTMKASGHSMRQDCDLSQRISSALRLHIAAHNVGTPDEARTSEQLAIYVSFIGNEGFDDVRYYVIRPNSAGVGGGGADQEWWIVGSRMYILVELPAPSKPFEGPTKSHDIDIILPFYYETPDRHITATSFRVEVVKKTGLYTTVLNECTISLANPPKGYKKIANINNNAREKKDAIETVVPQTSWNFRSLNPVPAPDMYHGSLYCPELEKYTDAFGSDDFPGSEFNTLMIKDYAKTFAAPRLKMTGTLSGTVGVGVGPFFTDKNGMNVQSYHIFEGEELSWSLKDDEADVSLLQSPEVTVEVAGVTEEEIV